MFTKILKTIKYVSTRTVTGDRQHEFTGRVGVVKPTSVGFGPSPMIRLDNSPPRSPPPRPTQPTRSPGEKTKNDQRPPRDPEDSFSQPSFFDYAPSFLQDYNFDEEAGIYHLVAYETRYADAPLAVILTQDSPTSQGEPTSQGRPTSQGKSTAKGSSMPRGYPVAQPTPMSQQENSTAKNNSATKDIPGEQKMPGARKIPDTQNVNWAQDIYGAQRIPGSNPKKENHENERPGKLRITRIWSLSEHVEYFV